MESKEYWVSSLKMIFWVKTEDDVIIDSAPIGKKFIGQKFDKLKNWMEKQGDFKCQEIQIYYMDEEYYEEWKLSHEEEENKLRIDLEKEFNEIVIWDEND